MGRPPYNPYSRKLQSAQCFDKLSASLHSRWIFIVRPTIIEGFIDYLAIFMRGLLAGRLSGGLLYPEAEMFKDMPYYLRIGNETDDLHLPSTAGATEGFRPTIENCMLRAIVETQDYQDFITHYVW